jgi:protein-S-isoprenylcysteine O-methyltransferase Ste14
VFLVVAPGVVAGVGPWLVTGWHGRGALWPVGAVLVVAGAAVLLHAFARFVVEGIGTPAPVAPTESLVIGGLYGWVRNPMYLAVGAIIVGQALIFGSWPLVLYALVFAAAVVTFVRLYEEPTMERRFGEQYAAYRRSVPGWWPRRPA